MNIYATSDEKIIVRTSSEEEGEKLINNGLEFKMKYAGRVGFLPIRYIEAIAFEFMETPKSLTAQQYLKLYREKGEQDGKR